ncbi:hypothetical protein GA845_38865 [Burkholderia pseudomallei]|nr:hypothetical protein [Burkholderia pseudomallei]
MRAHPATRPRPNSGAPGVGASLSKNSIAAAGRCAAAAAASERMPACADSSRDKPARTGRAPRRRDLGALRAVPFARPSIRNFPALFFLGKRMMIAAHPAHPHTETL